jgi:lysophospholipase L1-like esterase
MTRPVARLALTVLILLALPLAAAQAAPKRVLVFGDSNSWGWVPKETGIPSERYPPEQQWPRVMWGLLGGEYEVVTDALSGRTTDAPDPGAPMGGAALDGSAYLPAAVAAHFPLDLVVIMLGTNDTKAVFKRSPFRIALGAGRLVDIVQSSGRMFGGGWYDYPAPRVLLVAPPPLGPQTVLGEVFEGEVGVERSKGLAAAYRGVAQAAGASFFDAGSVIRTDGSDGVHLTGETQRRLGEAMAEQVRAALR